MKIILKNVCTADYYQNEVEKEKPDKKGKTNFFYQQR